MRLSDVWAVWVGWGRDEATESGEDRTGVGRPSRLADFHDCLDLDREA